MVCVDAGFGLGLEHILEGTESLAHISHAQRTAGIDDIAAGGAIAFHQPGLLGQSVWRGHMAHHQKAHRFHAQMACVFDVLTRNISFRAMGRHTHNASPCLVGSLQVMNRANAWQQQCRNLGVLHDTGDRRYPFDVGMGAEPVVEAAALQTVAVGYLDGIDARLVQRPGDGHCLLQAVLVPNRVAAVTQGHVRDVEFVLGCRHGRFFRWWRVRAASGMPCAQPCAARRWS